MDLFYLNEKFYLNAINILILIILYIIELPHSIFFRRFKFSRLLKKISTMTLFEKFFIFFLLLGSYHFDILVGDVKTKNLILFLFFFGVSLLSLFKFYNQDRSFVSFIESFSFLLFSLLVIFNLSSNIKSLSNGILILNLVLLSAIYVLSISKDNNRELNINKSNNSFLILKKCINISFYVFSIITIIGFMETLNVYTRYLYFIGSVIFLQSIKHISIINKVNIERNRLIVTNLLFIGLFLITNYEKFL